MNSLTISKFEKLSISKYCDQYHLQLNSRFALCCDLEHVSGVLILRDCYVYSYARENCVSVSHKCLSVLSKQSEYESRFMFEWYAGNSMKANAEKF